MLTTAQLAVLIRYRWNEQRFESQGTAVEKNLMHGVDWEALAELLANLRLYQQRLVSPAFAHRTYTQLLAACADEETAQTLLGYASTL